MLCVQDHDAHQHPAAYGGPNHLELGSARIKRLKKTWEAFVAAARQPHPEVLAVLNIFGSLESIHSMKLVFQRPGGGIEFERTYHLHEGPSESWINLALDELGWLNKTIKLSVINEPLAVEWCTSCPKRSLSRTVNKGLAAKLTAASWETDSVATVYLNPTRPSAAIFVFLGARSSIRAIFIYAAAGIYTTSVMILRSGSQQKNPGLRPRPLGVPVRALIALLPNYGCIEFHLLR